MIERQIFFARPGVNHGEIRHVGRPVERILAHGDKLHGVPAFANRFFFAAERRIDEPEPAPGLRIIRLIAHVFFLNDSGRFKGALRSRFVPKGPRGYTDEPIARPKGIVVEIAQSLGSDRLKRADNAGLIAGRERRIKKAVGDFRRSLRIVTENSGQTFAQRLEIAAFEKGTCASWVRVN